MLLLSLSHTVPLFTPSQKEKAKEDQRFQNKYYHVFISLLLKLKLSLEILI